MRIKPFSAKFMSVFVKFKPFFIDYTPFTILRCHFVALYLLSASAPNLTTSGLVDECFDVRTNLVHKSASINERTDKYAVDGLAVLVRV